MFVGAAGAVGADAVAQFDAASAEVVGEDLELVGGGLAVFVAGAGGSSSFKELVVVVENVLRVDRDVALSGVEAAVAGELCGDVDGELVGDELGEVEPSEVVGCRPKEGPVAVAQSGPGGLPPRASV